MEKIRYAIWEDNPELWPSGPESAMEEDTE
jgi:hypothetical protein